MTPRIFIQTCIGREDYAATLATALPQAVFIKDEARDPLRTWIRMLRTAGPHPAIFLEDDVVLAPNFVTEANAVIAHHGASVISFFSRAITTAGYYAGRHFAYNQAYWLPAGMAARLAGFAQRRVPEGPSLDPVTHELAAELDQVTRDFLKKTEQRFYQAVPSLVDHIVGPSAISTRRPKKRTSPTFMRKERV